VNGPRLLSYIVALVLFTAAPALGQIIPRGGGGGGGGGGGDASAANQTTQIGALPLEDVAHVSGDRGSFSLGVENSDLTAFTAGDKDYTPFGVTSLGQGIGIPMLSGEIATGNQLGKAEGVLHADGDAGVPALVIRNSATTPTAITGLDLRYSLIGVTSLTQVLTTQHHSTAYLTSIQVSKLEDTPHATGDAGIPDWGVVNTGFSGLAANLDYVPKAHSTDGAYFTNPVLSTVVGDARAVIKNEDTASGGGMAGMATLGIRNEDRTQLAGTDADYIQFSTNRFGETHKAPSGDEFFAITDTAIAAVSQNFAFGFTSKKVFISAPSTNGDGVCIDHIGGTAVCPAGDTAGDDVLEPGESLSFDDHAVSSISAISASGTNTIVVRAFN